jgi:MoaA/NifB/PqqE/SkfB family radical SAM enzyme
MHKEIDRFIFYAKESKIGNIKISTNGSFLTRKKITELCRAGLDYLSISVDGVTQKSYEEFRK